MGLIYADIELTNGDDLALVRRKIMDQDEVKRMRVSALVDTGSYMLAINENVQELLQFPVVDSQKAQLANGQIVRCDVVGSVELRFENRATTCRALVLPGDSEVLLGAIPLEGMDVIIHPLWQELIVNPDSPDVAIMKMKKAA